MIMIEYIPWLETIPFRCRLCYVKVPNRTKKLKFNIRGRSVMLAVLT